jgi:hypothetical protein
MLMPPAEYDKPYIGELTIKRVATEQDRYFMPPTTRAIDTGAGGTQPAAQRGAPMQRSIAQVKARFPNEIAQIAATFGVDIDTAAGMFLTQQGIGMQAGGWVDDNTPQAGLGDRPQYYMPPAPPVVGGYSKFPPGQNRYGGWPKAPNPPDKPPGYSGMGIHIFNETGRLQHIPHFDLPALERRGLVRFHPEEWERFLRETPRSTHIEARPTEDRQRNRTQGAKAACEGCGHLEGGEVARNRDWHGAAHRR